MRLDSAAAPATVFDCELWIISQETCLVVVFAFGGKELLVCLIFQCKLNFYVKSDEL